MRAYSMDLRRSIVRAYDAGQGSQRQLARLFGVSPSFVQKLLQHYRRTGDIIPKPHSGGHPGKITRHLAGIARVRRQWPEASLQELCARFTAETHVAISRATMSRAVRRLNRRENVDAHLHEHEAAEDRSSPVSRAEADEGSEK